MAAEEKLFSNQPYAIRVQVVRKIKDERDTVLVFGLIIVCEGRHINYERHFFLVHVYGMVCLQVDGVMFVVCVYERE